MVRTDIKPQMALYNVKYQIMIQSIYDASKTLLLSRQFI
jgi:hypothetical protein